ncbi:MAG TPA: hypothetical protein VIK61_08885 [Acidimicrobiia bacterium]
MARPSGRVTALVVAVTALVIAVAALMVALTRNPGHASVASATTTMVTSSAASVPRAGTLSVDGTGRPTLELVGYVRIPITHIGGYTWAGRLIAAPPSVLSLSGNPDVGGIGQRVDGTAVVRDFRSTWVGTFPKGNLIGERVTFQVVSYRGKPFVELLGGSVSGAAPTTTATTAP